MTDEQEIMRTLQQTSIKPPAEEKQAMGMTIICPHCSALRTFKITENLRLILNRASDSINIGTSCLVCSRTFSVTLGWFEEKEGYSYENIGGAIESATRVQDSAGLRPNEEMREILETVGFGVASGANYFQHKIKCYECGLHFVVCSDFEDWPDKGTTREQRLGEATGLIYCPECGSHGRKLHWLETADGFIFQMVPGIAAKPVSL